jgi:hypothetical protein
MARRFIDTLPVTEESLIKTAQDRGRYSPGTHHSGHLTVRSSLPLQPAENLLAEETDAPPDLAFLSAGSIQLGIARASHDSASNPIRRSYYR